jgi:hypothetical protein
VREREIQNQIFRAFGTIQGLRVWRQNSGGARFGNQLVRFNIPGAADITGLIPMTPICPNCGGSCQPIGARLEIEVKSEDGKQSQDQVNFQRIIERHHGIYILARSVDDVWAKIGGYLNGGGK